MQQRGNERGLVHKKRQRHQSISQQFITIPSTLQIYKITCKSDKRKTNARTHTQNTHTCTQMKTLKTSQTQDKDLQRILILLFSTR